MAFDPSRHHRRSIRLRGYDYAQAGAYFITVCVKDRSCMFGTVRGGVMRSNALGHIVRDVWNGLPRHYAHFVLDRFVVMPNHVHGIVGLVGHAMDDVGDGRTVGASLKPAPTPTTAPPPGPPSTPTTAPPTRARRHGLPEIVRAFKTFSARHINAYRRTPGTPVWQRNYYERIIHNARDHDRTARYIEQNPHRWAQDTLHPEYHAPRRFG